MQNLDLLGLLLLMAAVGFVLGGLSGSLWRVGQFGDAVSRAWRAGFDAGRTDCDVDDREIGYGLGYADAVDAVRSMLTAGLDAMVAPPWDKGDAEGGDDE